MVRLEASSMKKLSSKQIFQFHYGAIGGRQN
jgi:hypothetical protein